MKPKWIEIKSQNVLILVHHIVSIEMTVVATGARIRITTSWGSYLVDYSDEESAISAMRIIRDFVLDSAENHLTL